MNSNSKNYYKDDDCSKKEKKVCPTIIKCGTPSATTIPAATVAGTTFTLASLTLNTSCLCDPCIKLEFASNTVTTAFVGSISVQVFKLCGNQFTPIPVGPAWTFSNGAAITDAETFSFFICDCDSCFKDCCTYTVVATVTSAVTAGTLAINNTALGAIATCGSQCC
jgi:hypothetical protein